MKSSASFVPVLALMLTAYATFASAAPAPRPTGKTGPPSHMAAPSVRPPTQEVFDHDGTEAPRDPATHDRIQAAPPGQFLVPQGSRWRQNSTSPFVGGFGGGVTPFGGGGFGGSGFGVGFGGGTVLDPNTQDRINIPEEGTMLLPTPQGEGSQPQDQYELVPYRP